MTPLVETPRSDGAPPERSSEDPKLIRVQREQDRLTREFAELSESVHRRGCPDSLLRRHRNLTSLLGDLERQERRLLLDATLVDIGGEGA